jgi:hypothetical protein
MPGYRYRLYNADGDEVGELESLIPNWTVGETLMTGGGRRYRILNIVGLDAGGDLGAEFEAVFVVEPAPTQETIIHDVPPKWFCSCEGPDGMVAHPLDEPECAACGDRLPEHRR